MSDLIRAAMRELAQRSVAARRRNPEALAARMAEIGRVGGKAGKGKPKRKADKHDLS